MQKPTPWILDEGLLMARALEAYLIPHGHHVALGGSVLHRGTSDKDLDLFIYPHGTESPKISQLLSLLEKYFGTPLVSAVENKNKTRYAGCKAIYVVVLPDGKRVDIFIVEKSIDAIISG